MSKPDTTPPPAKPRVTFHDETGLAMGPKPEGGFDEGEEVFVAPARHAVTAEHEVDAAIWGKVGRFLHYTKPHGFAVVEVDRQPWLLHPEEVGRVADRQLVARFCQGSPPHERDVRVLADGFGPDVDDTDEEGREMLWDWSHVRDSSPRAWAAMADKVRELTGGAS